MEEENKVHNKGYFLKTWWLLAHSFFGLMLYNLSFCPSTLCKMIPTLFTEENKTALHHSI